MKRKLWTKVRGGLGAAALAAMVASAGSGAAHAQDVDDGLLKDADFLNSVLSSYIRSHVYDDYSYGTGVSDVGVEDLIFGLQDAVAWSTEYLTEVRLLERIERANAIVVLEGYALGNGPDLAAQYGADEAFQNTVWYLVEEGVLGTMGSSVDSAQITLSGCRAVRRYFDGADYSACARYGEEATYPVPMPEYYPISAPHDGGGVVDFTNVEMTLRNADLGEATIVDPTVDIPVVWTESVGGEQQAIRLDIAATETEQTLYLRTLADPGVDPVLAIYLGDPDALAGDVVVPSDDRHLYSDDDALPNFNSEVVFTHHQAATYWIVLSEYSGQPGSVELTLSDVGFHMVPVDAEVQQTFDLTGEIIGQIQETGGFRVQIDPVIIGSDPQVVQFTMPDTGLSGPVYVWTESVGIDPVAELYEATIMADDTMTVPLAPADIIQSSDDGPPPLELNPIMEFYPDGEQTYWLRIHEYWGESGQVRAVISNTPPW
ncbi:MAG: hypothetical protein RIM33_06215 [Alphaproteobacteria bacterium]